MSTSDLFDLTDKVAVVTGGSRGLGREMVLAFAERGADVVVASRKLDNCEAVAAEVRERFGRRAIPVAYHAGSWDDAQRLFDTTISEFGTIDVLVNNAGMSPLYPSVDAITEELYDKVMAVNLKGPFRLSRSPARTWRHTVAARSSSSRRSRHAAPRPTSSSTAPRRPV
jgi:NAD(P)-dependent dehydrogenase (short-subunit alcohol dehydrogenase family)